MRYLNFLRKLNYNNNSDAGRGFTLLLNATSSLSPITMANIQTTQHNTTHREKWACAHCREISQQKSFGLTKISQTCASAYGAYSSTAHTLLRLVGRPWRAHRAATSTSAEGITSKNSTLSTYHLHSPFPYRDWWCERHERQWSAHFQKADGCGRSTRTSIIKDPPYIRIHYISPHPLYRWRPTRHIRDFPFFQLLFGAIPKLA